MSIDSLYCDNWAFDYWGKGTALTVTSATPTKPTLFPLVPCGSGTGDMVTLGCLATDFTPSSLTFSWNKKGAALTDFIQYPPAQKDNLFTGVSQVRVKRQDWEAKETFQCAVTHVAGNVAVDMKDPEISKLPTLKVLTSSDEGTETSFSCFAKDFSPNAYEIKWLKDEEEIFNKLYEIITPSYERKTDNGTILYSAASFLTVQSSELSDGVTKFTFTGCPEADVDIKIIGPTMEDLFLKKKGAVKCQVKVNNPSVERVMWEDEAGNNMLEVQNPTKGSKETIDLSLDITYDEWSKGLTRFCIVEHSELVNPLKKAYERKIGTFNRDERPNCFLMLAEGPTQRPSVFMLPPVEQTKTDMVILTCYVKDFFPKDVLVSWLVDDEPADLHYDFNTTNPIENNGLYSVYAQLSLSLDQWKSNDVVYNCVVHHESVVNTTKAIVRSIGYRTFEKTNLVNLNMNIPETCKIH
ncbi:hypothetical protein PAMP_009335 [Pampus punctatissimus]